MPAFGLTSNVEEFEQALGNVSEGVVADKLNLFMRKTMFDLMRMVIQKTPVDTGRARGGWTAVEGLTGVGRLGLASIASPGGSGTSTQESAVQEGRSKSNLEENLSGVSKAITVTNAVEYITLLEFGHSDQAPDGMVRVSIREFAAKSQFLEDLGGDIESAYMGA